MLPVSTIAAFLLFGSVTLSYVIYRTYRHVRPASTSAQVSAPAAPTNGKPVEGLVAGETSLEQLARAGTELGLLALITWLCENKPVFEHSNKVHDLDFFAFIVLTACLVAFLFSVHHAPKDQGILNRDQTEEWRGFMQMVFLLYHYFALEEVYPLIRLFISCYVFLTGFGNTSFFYLKRDYSIVRLLSMLWRLCFSCIILAMTHNNPIILYYIVPLHTFYFLVAYVTMSLFERKINYTHYGLKLKLVALGLVLFAVWEFPAIFELVFSFLSDEPHPGAPVGAYGTRYEWQFRSGLDHYSSFFGMVFACGFPVLELRETNAISKSRIIQVGLSVIFVVCILGWYYILFPLPKFQYNARHAYTFIFPMCGYLFLRNLTPYLRRVHVGMFAFAGKYTLETYLLQHHVWLTSNAKTVLVLLPGFPKANFVMVSILYFLLSVKLYDLTVKTKSLLIPANDAKGAIINLIVLGGAVGLCFALAQFVTAFASSDMEFLLMLLLLALLSSIWILGGVLFVKQHQAETSPRMVRGLLLIFSVVFFVIGLACAAFPLVPVEDPISCNPNHGDWVRPFAGLCGESPQSNFAYCSSRGWAWSVTDQKRCGWKRISKLESFDTILLVGDEDQYALAMARIADPTFRYSAKDPAMEFADGKIKRVKKVEDLRTQPLKANTLVVCQTASMYDACRNLKTGVGIVLQNSREDSVEGLIAVDVLHIKTTANKADVLDKDVYRDVVYDVATQIILNYATKTMRKPAVPSAPPPGGVAHDPMYGMAFLVVALFSLFMGDGYLGLAATASRIFGFEKTVTWEKAMEKIHALVPGLHSGITQEPSIEVANLPTTARERDVEKDHGSDADDTSTLIQKS